MNSMGQLVSINANLDEESAQMLALEFGVELEIVHERTAEDAMLESFGADDSAPEDLVPRPPVITILGHVDHGKTSLLDKIRKANVVQTESGGITQHIGAYTVEHGDHSITFVDTPGHEAFTAMRARGANVTDIVVLVVAADDGVMPQTQEAIAHAKAANVPIVVALNKIDLPNVNINKIYGELSQQELVPEEYGGDTPVIKTSALTGAGIPELLEMLQIVAELRIDLKANPKRAAKGTCLEASISEGRGVVATVLVQDGTLKVGDVMVCGDGFGRVRALFDDKGRSVTEAGPSTPVEVSGLDAVPTAGEKFAVVDDISHAREIAEARRFRTRGVALGERQSITLENLYSKMAEQKVKSLNLILKADVQGSLEALLKELEKLENAEVPIRVLLKGVGGISESDILLADASQAIVIGFRVAPEDRAISLADEKKIEIRRYDIIYQVTDEIKKAVEGMLVPEIKEVHLGRAVVRQVFKISKVGAVAGCFVTQGTIERAVEGPDHPRRPRDLQGLGRGPQAVQGRRQGGPRGVRVRHQDHQLRRPEDRRRDRGVPDRRDPPDALTGPIGPADRMTAPDAWLSRASVESAAIEVADPSVTGSLVGGRPVTVSTLRLDLRVGPYHSPRDKRRQLQAIMDKLHSHFNVSVAGARRRRPARTGGPRGRRRGPDPPRRPGDARAGRRRVAAHPRAEVLGHAITEV